MVKLGVETYQETRWRGSIPAIIVFKGLEYLADLQRPSTASTKGKKPFNFKQLKHLKHLKQAVPVRDTRRTYVRVYSIKLFKILRYYTYKKNKGFSRHISAVLAWEMLRY